LLQGARYRGLKKLGDENYNAWAHGLSKAGYATDKKYGPKLIHLIEDLELYRYD
jgi:flagellum-specific peptidoglycan hydrolase FlgJ